MSTNSANNKDNRGIYLTVTFLGKVIENESFTPLEQKLDLDYLKEITPKISKTF